MLLYSSWGAGRTNLISIQGHSCNYILKLQEQNCIVRSFLDHKWIPSSEGNSSFHSISTNSTSKKSFAFGGILFAHVKEASKAEPPLPLTPWARVKQVTTCSPCSHVSVLYFTDPSEHLGFSTEPRPPSYSSCHETFSTSSADTPLLRHAFHCSHSAKDEQLSLAQTAKRLPIFGTWSLVSLWGS